MGEWVQQPHSRESEVPRESQHSKEVGTIQSFRVRNVHCTQRKHERTEGAQGTVCTWPGSGRSECGPASRKNPAAVQCSVHGNLPTSPGDVCGRDTISFPTGFSLLLHIQDCEGTSGHVNMDVSISRTDPQKVGHRQPALPSVHLAKLRTLLRAGAEIQTLKSLRKQSVLWGRLGTSQVALTNRPAGLPQTLSHKRPWSLPQLRSTMPPGEMRQSEWLILWGKKQRKKEKVIPFHS